MLRQLASQGTNDLELPAANWAQPANNGNRCLWVRFCLVGSPGDE